MSESIPPSSEQVREWKNDVKTDIHDMKTELQGIKAELVAIKLGMTDKIEIENLRVRIRKLEDFKLVLVTGALIFNFLLAIAMRFLIK